MAAMVIVNTPGDWSAVYAPLLHAPWHGWTPTDLIFPFFVFIMGVSITLSPRSGGSVLVILRRAAALFGLGLLLALYPRFDLGTVRIMGVLQRLALCYLAAALVYRAVRDRDEQTRLHVAIGGAALLLVAYWAIVSFVASPGGVAGDLTAAGHLGGWIDRTIFGEAHLWRQSRTWDPEGLFSTLPAIATALTGLAAGVVLASGRSPIEKTATLLVAGAIGVAAGAVWDQRFPINKNLWTSSYVLLTSGLASIAMAICYWIADGKPKTASAAGALNGRGRLGLLRPAVVMGTNALALFVASGLIVKTLVWIKVTASDGAPITLYRWIFLHGFAPWAAPKVASLAFAFAALVLLYLPLEWMYRRRWFFRV